MPKGETAVCKGEIFLLVFIFQMFHNEQSDSKNGPREEGVPGSQRHAQHLLLYFAPPNPLLSATSLRTQMSAYPVTAESPVSTHPGTQQTLNKTCAREKRRSPHFTAKETEVQEPSAQGYRASKGTNVEELHLSREFLPPTQGVKVTHSQKSPVKSTKHDA